MPTLDAKWILALAGPLFLVLAGWQWWRWGRLGPKGKALLRVGAVFVAVAAWLWWA
jgi:hypothetical protein